MTIRRFAIAFLFLIPGLALAEAAALQEASKLFRSGQHSKALDRVNGHLAGNPKDPQGRFLKGLIQAELDRTQDAIKTFTDLSTDYPELPEPYNNLAVLYASQGQYERAKNSLESAIRTHPSYATAHENLGDIYAKMASVAYDKALQLDKSNTSAQMKLSLVKDIFQPAGIDRAGSRSPTATTMAASTGSKAPAASAPATSAPVAADQSGTIESTVRNWAAAWADRDVPRYLGFYSPNFQTPAGMSRADWEAQRQHRVSRPSYINLDVSDFRIDVDGNEATASFKQVYKSNMLTSTMRKTLSLEKAGGDWKIVRER